MNYIKFIIIGMFFISLCACRGQQNMTVNSDVNLDRNITEEYIRDIMRRYISQKLSSDEQKLKKTLGDVILYCTRIDTVKNEMTLDLTPEDCARMGLPKYTCGVLKKMVKKEMKTERNREPEYWKKSLRLMMKDLIEEKQRRDSLGIGLKM